MTGITFMNSFDSFMFELSKIVQLNSDFHTSFGRVLTSSYFIMERKFNWVGVDYGSKLAGTTVVCYAKEDMIHLESSTKGKDADAWLNLFFANHSYRRVYFDAPLSLPNAYFGKGDDYFYRKCDRETKAMSPMFLGGLTARAMRLKSNVKNCEFKESYPSFLIKNVFNQNILYTKKKKYSGQLDDFLEEQTNIPFYKKPKNWHQVDATLCWISGLRDQSGAAIKIGQKSEGVITI